MAEAGAGEVFDRVVDRNAVDLQSRAGGEMASLFVAGRGARAGAERDAVSIEPRIADFDSTTRQRSVSDSDARGAGMLDATLECRGKVHGAHGSAAREPEGHATGNAELDRVRRSWADALNAQGRGDRDE